MSTTLCLTLSPMLKYYRSTMQFSEDAIVLNGMLQRLYIPKTTVHERPKTWSRWTGRSGVKTWNEFLKKKFDAKYALSVARPTATLFQF